MYWKDKRVVVTGGAGFVGRYLCSLLAQHGAQVVVADNRIPERSGWGYEVRHVNLTSPTDALYAVEGADVVIHMAARVAGVGVNSTQNFFMCKSNLDLASQVLHACLMHKVPRVLYVSTACVYPDKTDLSEKFGHFLEPSKGNVGYGWAKRMGERLAMWLEKEGGLSVSIVRPFNTYGPMDNFNPETCHVIPALIGRALRSKGKLTVWGNRDTTRSFIYVKDLARGIMLAAEKLPSGKVVNLGMDEPVSIELLARSILSLTGKRGTRLEFDESMPAGTPHRAPKTKLAKELIGFTAETELEDGLRETIAWYKKVRSDGKVMAH